MSLISCDALNVSIGQKQILQDVSLSVAAGELVGLIGPNGAGKSTLLSALAGIYPSSNAQMTLLGKRFTEHSVEERACAIAWLAQSGPIHWPLSVERVVSLGRTPYLQSGNSTSAKDASIVEQVMEQTDCAELRDRDATSLSGGERARVLLARALAGEPKVLLADEPVAALDLAHQLQTMELLRNYAHDGNCCLLVLHDLSLAARYCDRLVLIDQGRIVSSGTKQEVLTTDTLNNVYGVDAEISFGEHPSIVPKRIL